MTWNNVKSALRVAFAAAVVTLAAASAFAQTTGQILGTIVDAQGGERGVQEASGRPIRFDDATIVGGVGDVAAGAAAHKNFYTRLFPLLQQQYTKTPFGTTGLQLRKSLELRGSGLQISVLATKSTGE